MYKYMEYTFFVILNIILSFGVVLFPAIYLTIVISNNEFDNYIVEYLLVTIVIWVLFLLVKFLLFQWLYKLKRIFPNIFEILDNFIKSRHFQQKTLLSVFMLDILVLCFINYNIINLREIILLYIFLGGGALPCYLALLCSKSIKQENR